MRKFFKWLGLTLGALVLLAAAAGTWLVFINPSLNMTVNRYSLTALLDNPEALTSIGFLDGTWFDFHSGKLNDASWARRDLDRQRMAEGFAALKAYAREDLNADEQLTQDILLWFMDSIMRGAAFDFIGSGGLYPVNQMFGMQNGFPRFMQFQAVVTNDLTARNYVERLKAASAKFDAVIDVLEQQRVRGVVPPSFVIDQVIDEMRSFVAPEPGANVLVTSYNERLAATGLSAERKAELTAAATQAARDAVYPAYQRLIAKMESLRAATTPDAGVWKLPDGGAYYAMVLRQQTTTDMTPDEVHALGLSEVARIQAKMDVILKAEGLAEGSVAERMRALEQDPRYTWEDSDAGRAAILAEYTRLIAEVQQRMPDYFDHIPPQKVEVLRVPVFSEPGSAGAYYNAPSLDGKRPGRFFANLRDVRETAKWSMKTLAYHEAIPGHHHQIATAQNLDLPFARRFVPFTAYSEGWALYAEQLAFEMGMYEGDAPGNLGRLQAELFRAVRLVVDTGMHAKRWSREEAIQYMIANTGMSEGDVTREIERYAVMPGQACAYKVGMLKFLELRDRAREKLGPKFSLKAFHKTVLGNGAMPLSILEEVVDRWIAEELARG